MNAITPRPDLLAARRAFVARRLEELAGQHVTSQHITLRIQPGATAEERKAMAALLLAGLEDEA